MIKIGEFRLPLAVNTDSVGQLPVPSILAIRLMKRCTAHCVMCSFWKENDAGIAPKKLAELIREAADIGIKEICFTGGEPTAYEHLLFAVGEVARHGLDYSIITNSSNIKEFISNAGQIKYPKRIYFSIDSPVEKNHDLFRGTQGLWGKAVEGIKLVGEKSPSTRIIINSILTKKSFRDVPKMVLLSKLAPYHELNLLQIKGIKGLLLNKEEILEYNSVIVPEMVLAQKETGVVLRSETPFIYGEDLSSIDLSAGGDYSSWEYKKMDCTLCKKMLFIETSGDVFLCNNTPYFGSEFSAGNIYSQSLGEIITSARRAEVVAFIHSASLCKSCDPVNRAINRRDSVSPQRIKVPLLEGI